MPLSSVNFALYMFPSTWLSRTLDYCRRPLHFRHYSGGRKPCKAHRPGDVTFA